MIKWVMISLFTFIYYLFYLLHRYSQLRNYSNHIKLSFSGKHPDYKVPDRKYSKLQKKLYRGSFSQRKHINET